MRRLVCATLATLLVLAGSFEVPVRAVFQQAWTGVNGDPSSGMSTGALTTTNGNTICVGIFANVFNTVADGDVTDSKSNSYTRVGNFVTPGPATGAIFYADDIMGGASHTITFTRGDGSYAEIVAVELSGMVAAPFDASADNSGTDTEFDTTAATTTTTDTLCAVFITDADVTDWDAGTGFTERSTGPARVMLQTQDSVASGSRNATASRDGGTSTGYAAMIAGFEESGGAAAACNPVVRFLTLGIAGC